METLIIGDNVFEMSDSGESNFDLKDGVYIGMVKGVLEKESKKGEFQLALTFDIDGVWVSDYLTFGEKSKGIALLKLKKLGVRKNDAGNWDLKSIDDLIGNSVKLRIGKSDKDRLTIVGKDGDFGYFDIKENVEGEKKDIPF